MRKSKRLVALLAAFAVSPALAAALYQPLTVGTGDVTVVPSTSGYHVFDIVNNSPSATLCVNFGAAATISGTACPAGEITIPALWHRSWVNQEVPVGSVHAIASAASTPVSYYGN